MESNFTDTTNSKIAEYILRSITERFTSKVDEIIRAFSEDILGETQNVN